MLHSDDEPYSIQWTPNSITTDDGTIYCGAVRARVDSITPWDYQACSFADYALSLGEVLINKQKEAERRFRTFYVDSDGDVLVPYAKD